MSFIISIFSLNLVPRACPWAATFLFFILFSCNAYSQAERPNFLDIGGGINIKSDIREGNTKTLQFLQGKDPMIYPVPIINFKYEYEGLVLDLSRISFQIYKQEPVMFSALFSWGWGDAYSAEGMAERNSSMALGGSLRIFFLNFTYLRDIGNNSNGSVFSAVIEGRPFQITSWLPLMYSIGLELQDEKYVDYYYGVKSEEAGTNRQAYKGNSTINYFANVNSIIPISNTLDFTIGFGVKKLGKEITDSPTVKKDIDYNMQIGVVFKTSLLNP